MLHSTFSIPLGAGEWQLMKWAFKSENQCLTIYNRIALQLEYFIGRVLYQIIIGLIVSRSLLLFFKKDELRNTAVFFIF